MDFSSHADVRTDFKPWKTTLPSCISSPRNTLPARILGFVGIPSGFDGLCGMSRFLTGTERYLPGRTLSAHFRDKDRDLNYEVLNMSITAKKAASASPL